MEFFENFIQTEILSSPLNYTGSKTMLFPSLFELFPKDSKELWDVFAGGGSIFVNSVPYFRKIYVNDVISPLIQFYEFLQKNEWSTVSQKVNWTNIEQNSQKQFLNLRERFNKDKDFIDFFILCCSCTNNMMRFNKKFEFNSTWGKRHYNSKSQEKLKKYHERIFNCQKLSFLNLDFTKLEIVNPDAFVYLDPPYFICEAGYNCYWSKDHEIKLLDFILNLNNKGIKFMMSNVSEHKGVKNKFIEPYKEKFKVIDLNFNYDRVSRAGKSETKEIIVINY